MRGISLLVVICVAGVSWADDWPRWQGPRGDGVWREAGILKKFPAGGPKVLWRREIGGGFTGPAIAGGKVYVMDRQGEQFAKGKEAPTKAGLRGSERILCLDAADGKLLWKHEYVCLYTIRYARGPRTTPVVHGGKVYTLGAMGDLFCLDAAGGKVLWSKNLAKEYKTKPPVWGYAAHPLVDGDTLYTLAGGDGSAVVALDKDSGKERWRALTVEEVGYAPPVMIEAGGQRQLIVWHTEALNSLNPKTGEVLW